MIDIGRLQPDALYYQKEPSTPHSAQRLKAHTAAAHGVGADKLTVTL
jgi:hypothetical protein